MLPRLPDEPFGSFVLRQKIVWAREDIAFYQAELDAMLELSETSPNSYQAVIETLRHCVQTERRRLRELLRGMA